MKRGGLALLGAGLLFGGFRDPLSGAAAAAAVFALVALEGPLPFGAMAAWLPWLGWSVVCCAASGLAGPPVVARWTAFVFFAARAARWDASQRRDWAKGLIGAGGLLAVAAAWTGRPGFGAAMTGVLPPYYNYTAFLLAGAAAAALALAPEEKGGRRVVLWTLAAALAGTLLLARSRGGLLGLGLAALWLSWRRGGWKAAAAVAAAGALAFVLLPGRDALLKRGRFLGEARPRIWGVAVDMARDGLGAGPGGFGAGFRLRPVEAVGGAARWGLWTPYAHSEPLQAAAETGWTGLFLWLLGALLSVRAAFRGEADGARLAARAALVAALPQLLFDNMLQLPLLSLHVAACLGAAAAAESAPGPRATRPVAAVLAAAALLAALPAALCRPLPPTAPLHARLDRAARAVRLFPGDSDRREDRAWLLEESGSSAAAADWAEAARLAPKDAVYPWRLGRRLIEDRDPLAEGPLRRALELEPGFRTARADLAYVLARAGRREEARAELARAKEPSAGPTPLSGYERTVATLDPEAAARAEAALRKR